MLRGGLAGTAGLAAAALFGCGGSGRDRPTAANTAPGAAGAGQKLFNEDVLAVNDPKLPYPFVVAEPDTAPKRGGDYREAGQKDLAPLDPIVSTSTTTQMVPNTVGDRLLDFQYGGRKSPYKLDIEGDLAQSWELSPDGLTYTFRLTDKAKWQNKPPLNGRPFTAEDIRLVYNRNATAVNSVSKGYFETMASISAPNATTLQIKLKSPQPDFLVPLASRDSVIYPMELIDNGALANSRDAIGTGPYIATELVKGSHSKFVRNPDYWKPGKPYIDTIEVRTTPDSNARLAAFRARQLDYHSVGSKEEADVVIAGNPDVNISWSASTTIGGSLFAHINMKNPKWQDERVRQAMLLLHDRERMVQVLFGGYGIGAVRTLPWIFLFDQRPTQAELGPYERYAPDEAKKLLAAAGVENFSFELLGTTTVGGEDKALNFMIDSYRRNSVTIVPKLFDYTTFYSQYQQRKFSDASIGYIGGYTADQFYKDLVKTGGSINHQQISDPQLDTWADQQSAEINPKKRRELLRKIWDHAGQKAYHPFQTVGGFGSATIWRSSLRNFNQSSLPFCANCGSDGPRYVRYAWFDKDNPSYMPKRG